jgi:hypothetical protein
MRSCGVVEGDFGKGNLFIALQTQISGIRVANADELCGGVVGGDFGSGNLFIALQTQISGIRVANADELRSR